MSSLAGDVTGPPGQTLEVDLRHRQGGWFPEEFPGPVLQPEELHPPLPAAAQQAGELAQEGAAFHLGVDGENLGEPPFQAGEDQAGKILDAAAVKTQELIQGGQGGGDFQDRRHRIPKGGEVRGDAPGVTGVKKIPGRQNGAAAKLHCHPGAAKAEAGRPMSDV